MKHDIKSGKQILDSFIENIKENEDLDKEIVKSVVNLYGNDKLTKTNLVNALSDLRDNHEAE